MMVEKGKRGPKPRVDRPVRLQIWLPDSLRTQLDLFLFSGLENRVPKGEYSKFFEDRARDFFDELRREEKAK